MSEDQRGAIVERWLHLTRVVLPGMAAANRWPIRLDHCFMRVFLDHAAGGQWNLSVERPAIRHMHLADLERAVAAAEATIADPARLPTLNAASLAWRRDQRRRCMGRGGAAAGTLGGV